ncbi:MAG: Gfo/Idh/MocA family oxidoreductase [Candidatus Bathyarchaeota archaeon]|nr:Gfo/Idh/MocA family oxidoreductase [Candidatus Bathyarchaeota archaeon]
MEERKLRFGIIGLGKMGILHASLLNVFPEVKLVAFCEKSSLMNRIFKKVFSTTDSCVVSDLEKFRGLNLDAVYVTTPISSHSSIIKELFERKIVRNVFVEKTLASNYDQSKELCDLAKNVGAITMVGYMKRFSVVFNKAKELLSQGGLGEPQRFKAYAYSSDFIGLTKESKSSASRGGALSDLGSHVIDLALWMFGALEVQDLLSVVKNEAGSETSVSFTVVNSSGLTGKFDVSQSMPGYRMPEFGLSIECAKGKIEVNDDRMILTASNGIQKKWYRHDLNDCVHFSIGDPEYFRENLHFVNSLLANRQCDVNFDTASVVDYVIDQVRNKE